MWICARPAKAQRLTFELRHGSPLVQCSTALRARGVPAASQKTRNSYSTIAPGAYGLHEHWLVFAAMAGRLRLLPLTSSKLYNRAIGRWLEERGPAPPYYLRETNKQTARGCHQHLDFGDRCEQNDGPPAAA